MLSAMSMPGVHSPGKWRQRPTPGNTWGRDLPTGVASRGATHFPLAENVPARIYMTNANKNGVTALELHRSFLGSGPGWTDAPFLTHGAPATLEGAPSGSGRQPVGPSDTQADSA
jgi:hypothetical protein